MIRSPTPRSRPSTTLSIRPLSKITRVDAESSKNSSARSPPRPSAVFKTSSTAFEPSALTPKAFSSLSNSEVFELINLVSQALDDALGVLGEIRRDEQHQIPM